MKRRTKEILLLLMVASMTITGCGKNGETNSSQEGNSQITGNGVSENTDSEDNLAPEESEGMKPGGYSISDEVKNAEIGEPIFQFNDIVIDLRKPVLVGDVFDKFEKSEILYMYDTDNIEYQPGKYRWENICYVSAGGNEVVDMYYHNFGDTPITQRECRVYALTAQQDYEGVEFLALAGGVYADGKLNYKDIEKMYSSIEDVYVYNNAGAYVQVSYEDACGEIRYYFQYDDTTGEIIGINVHAYDLVDIEDIKAYVDATAQ